MTIEIYRGSFYNYTIYVAYCSNMTIRILILNIKLIPDPTPLGHATRLFYLFYVILTNRTNCSVKCLDKEVKVWLLLDVIFKLCIIGSNT